ncbi:hypothetical protein [Streptomyces sp. NBC_00872]|uniref:hypothetical protein n=1 Tax=Streptomyces sp. NBC_00872 TaxID=2903686 RepID=UPI00386683FA|nr:LuxR C-terminal-related transcriptional regulator [Streptomyces sp. NBC_00872]
MTDAVESDGTPDPLAFSNDALILYERIARGDGHVEPGTPALEELLSLGLVLPHIFETDLYLPAGRQYVWQRLVDRERATIEHSGDLLKQAVERLRGLPRFFAMLPPTATGGEDSGGIEFMKSPRDANAAVAAAVATVRSHVYTAHPKDRPREVLTISEVSDIERLKRGVRLRTVYPDSALSRAPENQWVAAVTAHGAEVRTAAAPFPRMIIIDDAFALISDREAVPAYSRTGWKVTHPGMLGFIQDTFKLLWHVADPWAGRNTPRTTGTITTPRARTILNAMSVGKTHDVIAKSLGVSTRTVTNALSPVYDALGIEAGDRFRLGLWWATSDERELEEESIKE